MKLEEFEFNLLNNFASMVYQEAKDKGWHTENLPDVARYVANLHSEVSELWEAYRDNKLNILCDKAEKMKYHQIDPLTCQEEELADIIIRAGDTAQALNIDLAKAVKNKLLFNRCRENRHGGKLA